MNRRVRFIRWSAYRSVLLIAIAISILYLFNQSNEILLVLSIAVSPIIVLGALTMAVLTVIQIGIARDDRITIVWFNFMLALLLWFLSAVVFAWDPLVAGVAAPYPSIADAFDLAAYLPLMYGLLMLIWPFRDIFAGWKGRTLIVIVVFASLLGLYLLLPPMLRQEQDIAGVLVSLAYPILDVMALSIAIPSLVIFVKGTYWRPCLFLVTGLVLASVADIHSGWSNLSATYYLGHPVELMFDFAFLSAALGFYLRRKQYMTKSL